MENLVASAQPACVLAREAKRCGIQHLHSHSCANSAILAMMLKRLTGVGYSMTLNANIDGWGGAMALKFADADFTIAITEWLLAQMKRDFPNPSTRSGAAGVDWCRQQKTTPNQKNRGGITEGCASSELAG